MDDKQVLLEKFLKNKFEIDIFRDFIARFFYKPEMKHSPKSKAIEGQFKDYIESFTEIAKYKDDDKKIITFMAVEIIKEKSVERARNMQRNYMAKFLEKNEYDAAIVAFYNESEKNWRLSFVRLDYSFSEKGILKEITPAKRYSYLVGEEEPNQTARKQFYVNLSNVEKNPTVDKLEAIFEIEKVTTDFFNRYKEQYLVLKEYLEGVDEFLETAKKFSFTSEEFAKKLMGQIAFLYFLQKKGWLGVKIVPHSISMDEFRKIWSDRKLENERDILKKVFVKHDEETLKISNSKVLALTIEEADILAGCFTGTKYEQKWGDGNRKFIRYLFESCQKSSTKINFFHDWLEPLFYTALNQKRGNNQYFKKFNCKIPFLNGGLFEHMYGNEEWQKKDFHIPNDIFSNKEETGILDTFDIYNFTMNEDEPLEKEVAVDPEMLGKIFENLLDVKDRKSKGAFYTPREIVHYMCKESLINYLVNETAIENTDIDNFIQLGEFIKDEDRRTIKRKEIDYLMPKSIIDKLAEVDKALENVKVADPAVGSGAFPLGMLNEIVKARDTLTEYFLIGKDKFEADEIRYERSMYNLKKNAMLNSIHAVDIEPSAADITKLRLWLSIIVDNDDEVIHELPNLDYKIMTGNSLIEEFEGMKLFDERLIEKDLGNKKMKTVNTGNIYTLFGSNRESILKKVVELRENYFKEKERANKEKIRADIERLEWDLIKATLTESGKEDKIKELEKLNKEKRKPYFLWKWNFLDVFQEKGGFDIVIGNPPYVGEKGNKEIFRPIAESSLGKRFHIGKMDLFYFFFHIGIDIAKERGTINLITTNYYITATSAVKLRQDIHDRTTILKLIDFNEMKLFENALGQHNLITLLEKGKSDKCSTNIITQNKGFISKEILYRILYLKDKNTNYYEIKQQFLFESNKYFIRLRGMEDSENSNDINNVILRKISKLTIYLGEISNINLGCHIVLTKITNKHLENFSGNFEKDDGVFILNENEVKKNWGNLKEYEKERFKPMIKNSDIISYYYRLSNSKLLYVNWNDNIEDFEYIKQHLLRFKQIMEFQKESYGEKNWPWYAIHRPREQKIFEAKEKIIVPYRSKKNIFGYSTSPLYGAGDVFFITSNTKDFDMKYLLGILNSKLYYYWLYYKGKRKGDILEMYYEPLANIPVKVISLEEQKPFITIVDQIITAKEQNFEADTTALEKQIDIMVYKLYNLTYEEVKVVEADFAMSEEDYDNYE